MADNIPEAFQALHERWDAIFAREQARFAAVNQDLPMTVDHAVDQSRLNMQEAVREMADERFMRDAVHDPDYRAMMVEREWGEVEHSPAYQGYEQELHERINDVEQQSAMEGRSIGDDGPEDVRLSREVREYDEENPTVLDRVESLHQRLETVAQETARSTQARQQDQGMGY